MDLCYTDAAQPLIPASYDLDDDQSVDSLSVEDLSMHDLSDVCT